MSSEAPRTPAFNPDTKTDAQRKSRSASAARITLRILERSSRAMTKAAPAAAFVGTISASSWVTNGNPLGILIGTGVGVVNALLIKEWQRGPSPF